MARPEQTLMQKSRKYQQKYPKEFSIVNNQLFCDICDTQLNATKKNFIDTHRRTKMHMKINSETEKKK